jgi:glycosyltransferase involved in cell wall biosynthesis
MKKNKIVILIWDMGLGGVQRQVADIVFALSENRTKPQVEIWIKNRRENLYPELNKLPRVKIIDLAGARGRLHTLIDFIKIARQLFGSKPSVLLTFHEYLSVFSLGIIKLLKISRQTRVIIYEPNFTTLYMKFKKRNGAWNWLIKSIYPSADKIITTTEAAALDLVQNYAISSDKITAIPTWTTQFPPKIASKKAYDLIFLGRLEPQKRPELFVKLIKQLHENHSIKAVGVICGDGAKRDELQHQIKENKLQKFVSLAGSIPPAKTKEFIANAKVLVLPSSFEGMPLVVVEAGACGIPVVVSDYPGVSEVVVNGKTGFIAKNQEELVSRTHLLLTNDELLKTMGEQAFDYVEKNHSHKNILDFTTVLCG